VKSVGSTYRRNMRLLFVCSGNLCRSPMAERLAGKWAEQALGAKAAALHISSAGVAARVGEPMDPRSAAALRRLGGEADGFTARALTADMAQESDLVLTMTRRQRRLVLEMAPRKLRSTFTLREAADLLSAADVAGLHALSPTIRARELAQRLDAARAHRRVFQDDDIVDPIGRRQEVHDRAADSIAAALRPLAAVLFVSDGVQGTRAPEGGVASGF
jgi:protein-tyrosine phosphatase